MFCGDGNPFCITSGLCITRAMIVCMADLEIALSFEKLRHRFMLDLFDNGEYQDIYPKSVANDPETTPLEHFIFQNMMSQLMELRDQMVMQVQPSYEDGKAIV
jgi:hypothetical protein